MIGNMRNRSQAVPPLRCSLPFHEQFGRAVVIAKRRCPVCQQSLVGITGFLKQVLDRLKRMLGLTVTLRIFGTAAYVTSYCV